METLQDEEGLLKVDDVAKFLDCSVYKVYRMSELGQLPCFKVGGSNRYKLSAIRNWVDKQLVVVPERIDAGRGRKIDRDDVDRLAERVKKEVLG